MSRWDTSFIELTSGLAVLKVSLSPMSAPPQTKIKSIRIKNVKGIAEKKFVFQTPEMIGNKFHVLVAPNGFGKSSFAAAFRGLRPRSMKLAKSDFHKNDETLEPELELVIATDGEEKTLLADPTGNGIHGEFSIAVINCRLKPKAIEHRYNPNIRATADLVVEPVVLVERIPDRPQDVPTQAILKDRFGSNGKVLPNIGQFLDNPILLSRILQLSELGRFRQQRLWKQIEPLLAAINQAVGSASQLKDQIQQNHLDALRQIEPLAQVAALLIDYDELSEVDRFLVAIAIGQTHVAEGSLLRRVRDWRHYQTGKEKCRDLLEGLNSNPEWIEVRPREDHGKLVVSFPSAGSMSNGQRDLFSFVAQLLKAEFTLTSGRAILVVDEVFDYLDEANLLAAQFYTSRFIKAFKESGREIFPLFLTHLDPEIFAHAVLGLGRKDSRKVHLLDQYLDVSRTGGIPLMVQKREDEQLKPVLGKYFFHYHPDDIEQTALFSSKGLRSTWGVASAFHRYCLDELNNYQEGVDDVDYVAVCVGARVAIEKAAFEQLADGEQKRRFTEEFNSRTSDKLDFVEEMGGRVPTAHRLLGLLYNDMLHHKPHFDYVSSIVSKMRNPAIRALMKEIAIPV